MAAVEAPSATTTTTTSTSSPAVVPFAAPATTWSVVGISAVVFAALSVAALLFFIAGAVMARGPQRQ